MIRISKPNSCITRILVISVLFIIIVLSCTKSKSNPASKSSVKYCTTINWSDTDGESGTFSGAAVNGSYNLVYVEYKTGDTQGGFPLHYDENNRLISDQPGVVYEYSQNNTQYYLSDISVDVTNGNGNGDYKFDSNGHLTSGVMNFTSGGLTGTVNGTYQYDSNEDPVLFTASGTLSSADGPVQVSMTVTGDFLTDKTSLLPFIPVFAPASSYFSAIPFVSKHLLNKWDYSLEVTGAPSITYTIQYNYTYDGNGNISKMVNNANTNNIYTFTYADCPK